MGLIPLLTACTASRSPELTVEVDLGSVAHSMRGGIGASWHAIDTPIVITDGRTEGGSAWGGNPPADADARWSELESHADWLGLDWLRVELEQRMYQPERDAFAWDDSEMQILYRILEWCDRRGAEVLLQQMWGNVDWNTFPEWQGNPRRRVHSGPVSMEAYAEGLAELVEHVVRRRGHHSVRWLGIVNEPGHGWSWWIRPPRNPLPLTPGLAAVREALDARGLELPLAAPGWTYLPTLDPEAIDFDHLVGAYDLHSYNAQFDGHEGGRYSLSEAERRLEEWARWAHARDKPFFLSELGSMVFGWGRDHPGPGTFEAGLKDAALVVRGLRAGVDAFNRWSFVNRGDLDGQWQLVDTWDPEADELLPTFAPHPNSYFMFGLLSRFTARRSDVLRVVAEDRVGTTPVLAAALRSPAEELTLILVNHDVADRAARIELEGLAEERELFLYSVGEGERDRADVRLDPREKVDLSPRRPGFEATVPRRSIVVYSTYELAHEDPGVTVDEVAP